MNDEELIDAIATCIFNEVFFGRYDSHTEELCLNAAESVISLLAQPSSGVERQSDLERIKRAANDLIRARFAGRT